MGEGVPATADELIEKVTGDVHTVGGFELEVQEALPQPEKSTDNDCAEEGAEKDEDVQVPAPAVQGPSPVPEPATDPAALQQAQAQWQMHYLALAINASVPDVGLRPPPQ